MMKSHIRKTASYAVSAKAPAVISIGPEYIADEAAREALLDLVMGAGRKRKSSEKIRRGRLPAEGLAFAARNDEGAIVGTVRLWNISAGSRDGAPVPALLLGPLAVHPAYAGCGIGSNLMREALKCAEMLGYGAVLLVGDPDYYQRFGFSDASTYALSMPGPYEKHRFQAVEFQPGYLAGAKGVLKATGRKIAKAA